jgi:NTP pyrophosphatase (non-canonical NTP hydrolase)
MKKLQVEIEKYLRERNWHNPEPSDIAKSIILEGAELLENFQWKNYNKKQILKDRELLNNIKYELADIVIYSIELANVLKLDLEKVVLEKLEKVKIKYPAKEIKKNSSNYFKIKKEYRKQGKN